MSFTLPQNNVTVGLTGHTNDHTKIYGCLSTALGAVVPPSGVTGGATDRAAINTLLNTSQGNVVLLPGAYYIDQPLQAGSGATLTGAGTGATYLYFAAGFSGTDMITFNGDLATLSRFTIAGQNTTYSANPSANGFSIAHRNSVTVRDVNLNYVNGYACRVVSDATSDSYNTTLDNVHSFSCASGCQLVGTLSGDHQQNTQLIGCNFDQCQSGDALQILDVNDAQVVALKATCTAGTGRCINIAGASAGVFITDPDLGPLAFGHEGLVIQASSGNSPNNITVHGGIIEGTTPCVSITDASKNIIIDGVIILNGQTSGVTVAGTANQITIANCVFSLDGVAAGTNYDLVWSSTGKGIVRGCWFTTPQGASSGQVTAAMNPSAGTLIVDGNYFNGAQAFNANYPKQATRNNGYNPVGHVTSPGLPGTGTPLTNPFGSDAFVYVVPAAVNTTVAIGGTTVNTLTGGGAPGYYFLPWNQSITLTYASGTPVWTWFVS